MAKRNGKIELMRFVFCIIIILFHCWSEVGVELNSPFTFFNKGRIGVEFFFIVTGYLMAANVTKRYNNNHLIRDSQAFLFRKLKSVLPYHIIVFFACLSLNLIFIKDKTILSGFKYCIDSLPSFFFIFSSGIGGKAINGPEWYISSMLITLTAIYPLAYRYKERFMRFVCPFIVLFSMGYMIHHNNTLGGAFFWMFNDTIPKVYLRAFAEICGGIFCYGIGEKIKRTEWSSFGRALLTAVEFICYALPIIYSFSDFPASYEGFAYYSLAIAVTLSFSEKTYFNKAFNNGLFYTLGKLSLPLFYTQRIGFIFIESTSLGDMRKRNQLAFCLLCTFVTAIILEAAAKLFFSKYNNIKNLLIKNGNSD